MHRGCTVSESGFEVRPVLRSSTAEGGCSTLAPSPPVTGNPTGSWRQEPPGRSTWAWTWWWRRRCAPATLGSSEYSPRPSDQTNTEPARLPLVPRNAVKRVYEKPIAIAGRINRPNRRAAGTAREVLDSTGFYKTVTIPPPGIAQDIRRINRIGLLCDQYQQRHQAFAITERLPAQSGRGYESSAS
jgi:hypothetical protein